MDTPTGEETTGLNRRSVLKRGAIVGGAMVWTVPAVQTLAAPAFAAGTNCTSEMTYKNSQGLCFKVVFNPGKACCDCVASQMAAYAFLGPLAGLVAVAMCLGNGSCTVSSQSIVPCS